MTVCTNKIWKCFSIYNYNFINIFDEFSIIYFIIFVFQYYLYTFLYLTECISNIILLKNVHQILLICIFIKIRHMYTKLCQFLIFYSKIKTLWTEHFKHFYNYVKKYHYKNENVTIKHKITFFINAIITIKNYIKMVVNSFYCDYFKQQSCSCFVFHNIINSISKIHLLPLTFY